MGMVEGMILLAIAALIAVAGYRAGRQAEREKMQEAAEAEDRAFHELNLIFLHRDEAALAQADRERGTDALARMRRMSPEKLEAFRAGRGGLYEELSDRLLIESRKAERVNALISADPELSRIMGGIAGVAR